MRAIKIMNDACYQDGEIVMPSDLISDFCEMLQDGDEFIGYLTNADTEEAVAFIAQAWGFDYEFVNI